MAEEEHKEQEGSGSGMIIIAAVIGGVIAGALITFLVMRARQPQQQIMGSPNIPYPAIPVQQPVEVQAPEPVVHNSEHVIVRKDKKGRIVEFITDREVHGG